MKTAEIRALGLLFIVQLLYAGAFTIAKDIMPSKILPFGFIFLRVWISWVLFAAINLLFLREKIHRADWPRLILCGLTGVSVNMLFFFWGLSLTSPINSAIIMTITPITVAVFAFFARKEQQSRLNIVGVLLGFVGAISLILAGSITDVSTNALGDLFILINAAVYAIYLVIVKPLMSKYNPITISSFTFFIGGLVVAPFGFSQMTQIKWNGFTAHDWFSFSYIIIGATFLTYLLNTIALKHIRSSVAGTFIYIQPVLATFIAILSGKYALNMYQIVFGCLILTGVYLATLNPGKKLF